MAWDSSILHLTLPQSLFIFTARINEDSLTGYLRTLAGEPCVGLGPLTFQVDFGI